MVNPFLAAIRNPIEAFTDFAVICAFLAALVLVTYAMTGNVITLYEQHRTGGWTVNPPYSWIVRLAAVPASAAIASWLVAAMFAMLT